MSTDEARSATAAALRDLNHEFIAADPPDEQLQALSGTVAEATATLRAAPRRDRLALMRAAAAEAGGFRMGGAGSGFGDRAVGGEANPTGVELAVDYEGDEIVATVVLRRAFEGAPGRAHGGIVAAAFDDVTGFVIGQLREPAFTGELTVRYLAPVPVETPLEMRARLDGRERRKLFISGDARDTTTGTLVATCTAIYITVDPSRFAGFPDPR
jgi:acyl-coenzyme A thioesterase PaaI-like protein